MNISVWHCYWYGPHETYVLVAETADALRAKIRKEIAAGWYPDEQGPLPEDFDELLDRYQDDNGDICYFSDFDYTVLDTAFCERLTG